MIRILLYGAAGLAWAFVAFFIGFYVTFPSDTVKTFVEYQSVGWFDREFALSMDSVRPWFTGARATNVTFYGIKRARRTKDNPDPGYDRTPIFTAESVVLKPKPIDYLMGKKGVGWSASMLGGSLDGSYATGETATDLSWSLDELDLSQLPLSGPDRTINLTGLLSGAADLHLDTEDPKESTGTFTLSAEGFGLAEGSKVAGFDLPAAPFTKATITAAVDSGKLTISEGEFEGSVISATLSGDISLNKKLLRSRSRFDLAFSLPDEFDKLAQLSPTLKRSKDEEGRYHCAVSGQLFAPSFRCGKATVGVGRKTLDGSVDRDSIAGPSLAGAGDPDMTDEERRAAREKRIQERRDRLRQRREAAAKARGDNPDAPPDARMPGDMEDGPEIPGQPGVNDNFPPDFNDPGPPEFDPNPDDENPNFVPGDDQTR